MKFYKSIKFFVFALFCGLMVSAGVVRAGAAEKAEEILNSNDIDEQFKKINQVINDAIMDIDDYQFNVLKELYKQKKNFVFWGALDSNDAVRLAGDEVYYEKITFLHIMLRTYHLHSLCAKKEVLNFFIECLNAFKKNPHSITSDDKKTTLTIDEFIEQYCQNFLIDQKKVMKEVNQYFLDKEEIWEEISKNGKIAKDILESKDKNSQFYQIDLLIASATNGTANSLDILEEMYKQNQDFIFFKSTNNYAFVNKENYDDVTLMHIMLHQYSISDNTNAEVFDFIAQCLTTFKQDPQNITSDDKKITLTIDQFIGKYCQKFLDDKEEMKKKHKSIITYIPKDQRYEISSGAAGLIIAGVPFVAACLAGMITKGGKQKLWHLPVSIVMYLAVKHGLNNNAYIKDYKGDRCNAYDYKRNGIFRGMPFLAYGAGVLAVEGAKKGFSKLAPVMMKLWTSKK